MKASVLLTIITSASASLCCIVPILPIIGGSGGLISTFSWLEPFRPFFIGGTVLLLGLAWYGAFKARKEDECGCESERTSFFKSKKFLAVITALSLLMISFPSYSRYLMSGNAGVSVADQEKTEKITLSVSGMTCSSCELNIEHEVIKLSGVSSVKASYSSKSVTVEFNRQKVDRETIMAAINKTGYKVEKSVNPLGRQAKADCCAKGICTPETCTNMPKVDVPNKKNLNLKVLSSLNDLKEAFNKERGKIRFVAILSSTCGWCLQGAQTVQKTVIEKMKEKDINVIIV